MSAPDDAGLAAKLLAGALAAVASLGGWILNATHKRIDSLARKVDERMITKEQFDEHAKSDERQLEALNEEMGRRRSIEKDLFEKVEEIGDRTEVRFTQIERTAADRHVELLKAIHAVGK